MGETERFMHQVKTVMRVDYLACMVWAAARSEAAPNASYAWLAACVTSQFDPPLVSPAKMSNAAGVEGSRPDHWLLTQLRTTLASTCKMFTFILTSPCYETVNFSFTISLTGLCLILSRYVTTRRDKSVSSPLSSPLRKCCVI